jgi:signal transduction histidine kinase
MNTFYKLINIEGLVIYSNIPQEFEHLYNTCTIGNEIIELGYKYGEIRHGKISSNNGIAYLLTTDVELIKRPRYFKEKLKVLYEQIEIIELIKIDLKNTMQADNRRLIHNITSFNGKNILELYSVVPENQVSKDFRTIRETIKGYLSKNPDGVADAFLRIAKNSIAMKSEFTVFKKIDGDPSLIQKQLFDIRKVVLLVIHVFYHDLKENDVYVEVEECNQKIKFDFETIRVALYHILDNAAKYIMPNSQLSVSFKSSNNGFMVVFDMWSMEIKTDELQEIEREGVSGGWAVKTGKAGDGLGIPIVKRILALNNADLIIKPNVQKQLKRYDGVFYSNNLFEIIFR